MYTVSIRYHFAGDTNTEHFQKLMGALAMEHIGTEGIYDKPGHVDGPTTGSFIWEMFGDLDEADRIEGVRKLSEHAGSIDTHSDILAPSWLIDRLDESLALYPKLSFDLIRLAVPEVRLIGLHHNLIYLEGGAHLGHGEFHGGSSIVTEYYHIQSDVTEDEATRIILETAKQTEETIGEFYVDTFIYPLVYDSSDHINDAVRGSVARAMGITHADHADSALEFAKLSEAVRKQLNPR